jgi:hypothetical protein
MDSQREPDYRTVIDTINHHRFDEEGLSGLGGLPQPDVRPAIDNCRLLESGDCWSARSMVVVS